MHERRQALGGYLPARAARADAARGPRRSTASTTLLEGSGKREISTTMAFVRLLTALLSRQEPRPARRADRAGRGAHLRHGGPVPPARHLRRRGSALRAGRSRPGDVLPRGPQGPDPPGGHQRGGRAVVVRSPRARAYANHGDPDDPVLHLLLDVRLPARRRPDLGRRRLAHARLPDGRHLRPHDALRRRPPAPGRPQPALAASTVPNCLAYDPTFALRAGGDRPRRPAPHVHRSRRTSSTTSRC